MNRPRTIDRELLLDHAEQILSKSGGAGLSFSSLAKSAGLSKASVQSVFSTRENLLEAIFDRWITEEHSRFEQVAGRQPDKKQKIQTHVEITHVESALSMRRVATTLTALIGSDIQMNRAIEWYRFRAGDLDAQTKEERQRRIAFLATEGAFFLRYLIGYQMTNQLWNEIFEDLIKMTKD